MGIPFRFLTLPQCSPLVYGDWLLLLVKLAGGEMARGWESKSVEAQIETAQTVQTRQMRPSERDRMREGLLLTRIKVASDLKVSRNPRHRQILEQALQHLDREIEFLK
jgi:hypothetical protein